MSMMPQHRFAQTLAVVFCAFSLCYFSRVTTVDAREYETTEETLSEAKELLDRYSRVQKRVLGDSSPDNSANVQYVDPIPNLAQGDMPSVMILPEQNPGLQKASQAFPKTDVVVLKNGLQLDGVIKNRDRKGGFWLETDPGIEIFFTKDEVERQYKIQ